MTAESNSPRTRRVVGIYAALAALVAVGLPLAVSAGNKRQAEPQIAGTYSLARSDPCLGNGFEILQSGEFATLKADQATPSGALRVQDGQLSGSVECSNGGTEELQARRQDDSLLVSIGGRELTADLDGETAPGAAPVAPPPASITGDYDIVPASTCLGAKLSISGDRNPLGLSAGGQSVGTLSYASGTVDDGQVRCAKGKLVPITGSTAGRNINLTIGSQSVRAEKRRDFSETVAIFFVAITAIMLAARAVGWGVAKLGFPRVMGEVLAGIMLGPTLFGAIAPSLQANLFPADIIPVLGVVANLGLIFYMFMIGLELDPGLLRGRVSQAAVISNASVAVPLFLGFVLAVFLYPLVGPDIDFLPFALFVGVAMSITAFPVLARILVERRMLKAPVGALSMASAAIDDVTAWFLIALATAVAAAGVATDVLQTVALSVGFCALMLFGVRPLLARVSVAYQEAGRVPGGWVVAIFAGILLSAYTTETIGIAVIFGAFIMGLVMPRNAGLTEDVTGRIEDFVVTLLLPVFFAYTGLRTDVGLLDRPELWLMTLAIVAVAIIGKFVGGTLAARLTGFDWRASAVIGTLMNTRGLTELIVLNLALEAGVITNALFSALVIMALVTTFMAGPLLRLLDPTNRYGVPVGDELETARQESDADFPALTVPERSVLVAPQSDAGLEQLLTIVEPLASAEPRREVILARPITPTQGAVTGARPGLQSQNRLLAEQGENLTEARNRLIDRGIAARAAAFISTDSGGDLSRLAEREGVDLVVTEGRRPLLGSGIPKGDVGVVLRTAPCDVAVLVAREGVHLFQAGTDDPVVVPFGGAEHDWAALELGAWIAAATGRKLQLLGAAPDGADGARLTRMLADAALLVQAYAGVMSEPVVVERSRSAVVEAADGAELLVVGLSERWRHEGLGATRSHIARSADSPVLFVRRGNRPGALAPQTDVTRFTWSTPGVQTAAPAP